MTSSYFSKIKIPLHLYNKKTTVIYSLDLVKSKNTPIISKFTETNLDDSTKSDEYFMREALKEAQKAFDLDEVPIGAVIVSNNRIIARAHNLTERLNDVTAHAEMQAFTSAAEFLGGKYLHNCTLYVTIEPCVMCTGASYWTQLNKIVYGAKDPKEHK